MGEEDQPKKNVSSKLAASELETLASMPSMALIASLRAPIALPDMAADEWNLTDAQT